LEYIDDPDKITINESKLIIAERLERLEVLRIRILKELEDKESE